ncbi:MAG TPA: GGDEF domain-containing protein [Thiomicrospira sp.]|nr:GGDEF domain-containing protein [Thiomicrospira sp.]
MERAEFKKLNVLFSLTMVFILISVVMLFAWRTHSEIKQFDQYQTSMIQKQAQVTVLEIEELITSIRNRMIAISLDNFFLKDFEQFKNVDELQEGLKTRFQHYFPEMYAFSIADEHGDIMGGDIDLFIGDVCQADLVLAADSLNNKHPAYNYRPWIHPKEGAYHFDMMFPTHALGETVVFFMSFKAELLQDAINRKAFIEDDIYLLRKDNPGLIEVAQGGVRNALKRDFHLTADELNAVATKQPVNNTRWEVAIVPKAEIRETFVRNSVLDAVSLFLGFLAFWVALFVFGLFEEHRKGRLMKHLHHLSSHDALTNLANRRFLYQAFDQSRSRRKESGDFSGLLYMDLNQFKPVNDRYGHETGDELLKLVSQRLLSCSREEDVVARVGGDEFVVLLNGIGKTEAEAEKHLLEAEKRCAERLAVEYVVKNVSFTVPPSIGSVMLTSADDSIDSLLKKADEKMYQMKQQSKMASV